MRLAERQGEIGQERLGLLGREDDRRAGVEACFKSAEKLELEGGFGCHCSSTAYPPTTTVAQVTPFSTVLVTIRIRSPDTSEEETASHPLRFGRLARRGSDDEIPLRRRGRPEDLLPRSGPRHVARAAPASRIPDVVPHVPRLDPGLGRRPPRGRPRSAWLRLLRRAEPGSVHIHIR